MKKQVFIITLLLLITGISVTLVARNISRGSEQETKNVTPTSGCKCYANGNSYSPGSNACLGGYKARCIAKSGVGEEAKDCGWDYLKDANGNNIKCD